MNNQPPNDEELLTSNGYIKNPRRGRCLKCRGYIKRGSGWQYGEAKINGKRVDWAVMWHVECLYEDSFLDKDEQDHNFVMDSIDDFNF